MDKDMIHLAETIHDLLVHLTPDDRAEIFRIVQGDYCGCGNEKPCYCSSLYDE